jgi:hypothetical protein
MPVKFVVGGLKSSAHLGWSQLTAHIILTAYMLWSIFGGASNRSIDLLVFGIAAQAAFLLMWIRRTFVFTPRGIQCEIGVPGLSRSKTIPYDQVRGLSIEGGLGHWTLYLVLDTEKIGLTAGKDRERLTGIAAHLQNLFPVAAISAP